MQAQGFVWLGVRTEELAAKAAFFAEVMGHDRTRRLASSRRVVDGELAEVSG